MRINEEGRSLIRIFKDEYEASETLANAQKAVNLLVRRRITTNQFSALVSLVMCIGIDDFKKSKMLQLINTRSLNAMIMAADEFDRYIYEINDHGDRVLDQFLLGVRECEKALFLKPELVSSRRR